MNRPDRTERLWGALTVVSVLVVLTGLPVSGEIGAVTRVGKLISWSIGAAFVLMLVSALRYDIARRRRLWLTPGRTREELSPMMADAALWRRRITNTGIGIAVGATLFIGGSLLRHASAGWGQYVRPGGPWQFVALVGVLTLMICVPGFVVAQIRHQRARHARNAAFACAVDAEMPRPPA